MSKKLILSLYKDSMRSCKILDKEMKRLRMHNINELSIGKKKKKNHIKKFHCIRNDYH